MVNAGYRMWVSSPLPLALGAILYFLGSLVWDIVWLPVISSFLGFSLLKDGIPMQAHKPRN